MIKKQIEQIKKQITEGVEKDNYRECAIYLKDQEETINFIVDHQYFEYDLDETWLYVSYDGGSEEGGYIPYSHCVKLSNILYITSEV